MESCYQIYIVFNNEKESEAICETIEDAMEIMRKLIGRPNVYSAILGHYSNEYPTGYNIICSIRNNSYLRGREM